MLPSVRSCVGHKVRSLPAVSSDRAAVTEPLLFLYPKWFQKASHDYQCRSLHTSRCTRLRAATRSDQTRGAICNLSAHRPLPTTDAKSRNPVYEKVQKIPVVVATPQGNHTSRPASKSNGGSRKRKESLTDFNGKTDYAKALAGEGGTVHNAPEVDGLELMRLLSRVPPRRPARWHEKKRFPTRFVKWLTGTSEENRWFHQDGGGCDIEVLPPTQDDPEYCHLLLCGSSRSQEMASQYLKDQVVQFAMTGTSQNSSSGRQADTHSGTEDADKPRSALQYARADKIEIPDVWTLRTFHEYVASIIQHRGPRTIERSLYPGDESRDQVVGKLLSELFSKSHLKSYHSTAALRLALQFFRGRTQLAPEALRVWIESSESGIVPDISCFNSEIKRCLAVRNSARVQYLFYEMTKMGVPPNIETWCMVLKTMKGWTDRLTTISFLLRHRTTSPSRDRQLLALLVVEADFARFVQDRAELDEFVEHMSRAFGSQWLSTPAIAEMIRQCLKLDKLETVSDVLALAHSHNIKLEHESSRLLMDAVRRTRNLQDCMMLFKASVPAQALPETQRNVELLFKTAWKDRMPNICRVLWHYAATHGSITYAMQKYVIRSSAHNAGPVTNEKTRFTKNLLAAATIGLDCNKNDVISMFPRLHNTGDVRHASEYLCRWTWNDGTRHEQYQLLHFILERDLTAWKNYEPMTGSYLLELLDQAYTLDMQWTNEKTLSNTTPAQILQQVISIELQAKPAHEPQSRIVKLAKQQEACITAGDNSVLLTASDSLAFERSKVLVGTVRQPITSSDDELESSRPYNLLTSNMTSSSIQSSTAAPAIVFTGSSVLDTLIHQLRSALQAV